MILIDTSLWVDHLRNADPTVNELLDEGRVLGHPFIIGEILMGNPGNRSGIRRLLEILPEVERASDRDVLNLVERYKIFDKGVGYIDAHLLASVRLTDQAKIWTRDRRMAGAAEKLGILALDLPGIQ